MRSSDGKGSAANSLTDGTTKRLEIQTEYSLTGQIIDTDERTKVTWCISVQNCVRHNSRTRNQCRLMGASVVGSQVLRR